MCMYVGMFTHGVLTLPVSWGHIVKGLPQPIFYSMLNGDSHRNKWQIRYSFPPGLVPF